MMGLKKDGKPWLPKSYKEYEGRRPYRMATKATHLTGDLSSEEPDICYIYGETKTYYVGMWLLGYGFGDVKFPKETTRKLTRKEADYWNTRGVQIGHQPINAIHIDEEDIEGEEEE